MFATMVNSQKFVEVGRGESVGLRFVYATARLQTSLYIYPCELPLSHGTKRGRTQVRSKRAFIAKPGEKTPIPTRTPAPCSFVMVVSDEIGGPGKLWSISRTLDRKREGHKHPAAVPGQRGWPGKCKDNPDIRFSYIQPLARSKDRKTVGVLPISSARR
jgi:hypothetical protein